MENANQSNNQSQKKENEFEVSQDFDLPNQTVSLLEKQKNLIAIEKSMFKNYSKYALSSITQIYFYENPIHQTNPLNKNLRPPEIYATAASGDSKSYCAGFSNGEIHVFEQLTRKIIQHSPDTILSLRYHPLKSYILLSISSAGEVVYSHIPSGKILSKFDITEKVPRCLDIPANGEKFAVGFADGEVQIFDEKTQTLEKTFKSGTSFTTGHLDQIHSVVFDKRDHNRIITGGRDKRLLLWDVRTAQCNEMVVGPLILGDTVDIKNNTIIAGNYDAPGNVQIFDIRNFKKAVKIIKTESQLYACKFSKRDTSDLFACGGYKKGAMKIFKLSNGNLESAIDGCEPVYSLDFSGNGSNIVYGCGDGGVRVVSV